MDINMNTSTKRDLSMFCMNARNYLVQGPGRTTSTSQIYTYAHDLKHQTLEMCDVIKIHAIFVKLYRMQPSARSRCKTMRIYFYSHSRALGN